MHPIFVGLAAFSIIFGGALFGIWVARRLPPSHFNAESRSAVAVSMSVVSTLSALALGLLITQASASFMARTEAVHALSASLLRLDRSLHNFGPSSSAAEAALRIYAATKLDELSSPGSTEHSNKSLDMLDRLTDAVVQLPPGNAEQHFLRQQAAGIVQNITDERWRLAEQNDQSMPTAFLAVLVFWLALLFVSFGVLSPRNITVTISLFSSAIAVSVGIYMIIELSTTKTGFIHTPLMSLQQAATAISA